MLPHLRRLLELALAWGPDAALRPTRSAVDVLGAHPAGLGAPLAEALGTRSPARTRDLAEDLGLEASGDPVADPSSSLDDEPWRADQREGRNRGMQARVGDHAIFFRKAAVEITFEEKRYLVVPQAAILVLVRDDLPI